MWKLLLLAGTGGFIGTCCRFLINRFFLIVIKTHLPLATFTINIIGCFIFGVLTGILVKTGHMNPRINALLIIGFCGGFTTFSTFTNESFVLGSNGELVAAFGYIFLSLIIGLVALWLGLIISR